MGGGFNTTKINYELSLEQLTWSDHKISSSFTNIKEKKDGKVRRAAKCDICVDPPVVTSHTGIVKHMNCHLNSKYKQLSNRTIAASMSKFCKINVTSEQNAKDSTSSGSSSTPVVVETTASTSSGNVSQSQTGDNDEAENVNLTNGTNVSNTDAAGQWANDMGEIVTNISEFKTPRPERPKSNSWKTDSMFDWTVKDLETMDHLQHGASRRPACKGDHREAGPYSCGCRPMYVNSYKHPYLDPPDAAVLPKAERTPIAFSRRKLYVVYHELFYPDHVMHMPCPNCGPVAGNVISHGWNPAGPRRILSPFEEADIICKQYECKICSTNFLGYDERVYKWLPEFVQLQQAAVVYRKTAVSSKVINWIIEEIINGKSFRNFRAMWLELCHINYLKTQASYYLSHLKKKPDAAKSFAPKDSKSLEEFGSFNNRARWNGRAPNRKFLRNLFLSFGSKGYSLRNKFMQSQVGTILMCDHTFKVAAVCTQKGFKVFEALLTVMNENNVILGYWFTQSKSMDELKEDLKQLSERLTKSSVDKIIWYTDNCCSDRGCLKDCFTQLNGCSYETVLKDAFHLMDTYKVSPKHPLYNLFLSFLRDAIFQNNPDDKNAVNENLVDRLIESEEVDIPKMLSSVRSNYYFKNNKIRRLIPEKEILHQRVDRVVQAFRRFDPTFINAKVLEKHASVLEHIDKGCITDPPLIPLYYQRADGSVGCARGTNGLESWHSFVDSLAASCASPVLVDVTLSHTTFRWNFNRLGNMGQTEIPISYDIGIMHTLHNLKQNFPDKITENFYGESIIQKIDTSLGTHPFGARYDLRKYTPGKDDSVQGAGLDIADQIHAEDDNVNEEQDGHDSVTESHNQEADVDLSVADGPTLSKLNKLSNLKVQSNESAETSSVLNQFSLFVFPRPVETSFEISLYVELFEQHSRRSVGVNGEKVLVNYVTMANDWNSRVEEAVASDAHQTRLYYKSPSHLRSFYTVIWKKFSVKSVLERFATEFSTLREELSTNVSSHLPVSTLSTQPNNQSARTSSLIAPSGADDPGEVLNDSSMNNFCDDCLVIHLQMSQNYIYSQNLLRSRGPVDRVAVENTSSNVTLNVSAPMGVDNAISGSPSSVDETPPPETLESLENQSLVEFVKEKGVNYQLIQWILDKRFQICCVCYTPRRVNGVSINGHVDGEKCPILSRDPSPKLQRESKNLQRRVCEKVAKFKKLKSLNMLPVPLVVSQVTAPVSALETLPKQPGTTVSVSPHPLSSTAATITSSVFQDVSAKAVSTAVATPHVTFNAPTEAPVLDDIDWDETDFSTAVESCAVLVPNNPASRLNDYDNFSWFFSEVKFVVDVAADGNCGFRALASALSNSGYYEDSLDWKGVRMLLLEELTGNPYWKDTYPDQFFREQIRILNWFKSPAYRDQWCSSYTVLLAASCFGVPINLVDMSTKTGNAFMPVTFNGRKPITLIYENDIHYKWVKELVRPQSICVFKRPFEKKKVEQPYEAAEMLKWKQHFAAYRVIFSGVGNVGYETIDDD